jgi:membrane dipeptidase
MFIVDAHLDLSYNALRGRDVLARAERQTKDEQGIPTVGLPDLRGGSVGLICGTIFCSPEEKEEGVPGYRTPEEAHTEGQRHLDWYAARCDEGHFGIVKTSGELPEQAVGETAPLPAILLLEGADPIREPAEASWWFEKGVRIVGLAWHRTRYAGGTHAPGPLTPEGVKLAKVLDEVGMIHDLSHLAEESYWQLLDQTEGPVMASHSNCRSIVPTDRQLSDAMIRAAGLRGGVIGINLYHKFLLPPAEFGKRRANLADVIPHIRHICDIIGDASHIGIGTDMDGGFGRGEIPDEISTSADLPRLADALAEANFSDHDIRGFMGQNWLDFFKRSLPA